MNYPRIRVIRINDLSTILRVVRIFVQNDKNFLLRRFANKRTEGNGYRLCYVVCTIGSKSFY